MLNISIFNIACTIINLLILYFVVRKFLFGRIDEILKKRQEEVDSATKAADIALEEAKSTKREYERKISQAEEEKETILASIKKQGYDEYEKIVLDARKKGDRIITEAKHNAEAEAEKAREEYAGELKDMVIDAASKIAATKHSAEDDSQLYDKFISEAGAHNG
ncbi:F0F1 ATP synthase subunit B family protein [Butyrivibrio sp. FCS014]|uniref:F0F1 ATP synthase subunit B family protein n=1 Tax=Butyrivibrio sp. FCS014 TaxID=1408304 RepID=UPI000463DB2A|nr:ATP synthase F0 subunit B [Butyrivibrio sp. FCS014]